MKKIIFSLLCMVAQASWADVVTYIERSWDGKQVVSQTKNVDATQISGSKSSETMTLDVGKWYYISANSTVERKRLIVPYEAHNTNEDNNKEIHIILCDGAQLKSVITFQGYNYPSSGTQYGTLHIHAQSDGENMGKIIANASKSGYDWRSITDCAGIGGTDESGDLNSNNHDSHHCGKLYVHGGDIYAKGNGYAAGIGGGDAGNGGTVYIYGGKVSAYGGTDAAGIGGGEDGNGGELYVYGGTVFADGTDWAAGIGGGEDGTGAKVEVLGGTVTAWAGGKAGDDGGLAFGGGDTGESRGSLKIGDHMMVHAGQNPDDAKGHLFTAAERVPACFYRPYAKIEPCTHGGKPTYTINGEGITGTHSLKCNYCKGYDNQTHTFDANNKCTVCGEGNILYTITMYVPKNDADGYGDPLNVQVAVGNTFTVPTPDYVPANTTFVGWVRSEPTQSEKYMYSDETLVTAGEVWTVSSNDNLVLKAKYKDNNITFSDNADIMGILIANDGKQVPMVTIKGRTMYKDGKWNTICLPFDFNFTTDGNPWNNDNPDVRMLKASAWDSNNKVLTLTFTEKNKDTEGNTISTLKAGTPYLIRWDDTNGKNIGGEDPDGTAFTAGPLTLKNERHNTYVGHVTFHGTYSPNKIYDGGDDGYNTRLYMGADNKLYYPTTEDYTVNAFRAYFVLEGGLYANKDGIHMLGEDSSNGARIVMNFGGGETTVIGGVEADTSLSTPHSSLQEWYSLDGRRLNGKPAARGIYIYNGKKMVVK